MKNSPIATMNDGETPDPSWYERMNAARGAFSRAAGDIVREGGALGPAFDEWYSEWLTVAREMHAVERRGRDMEALLRRLSTIGETGPIAWAVLTSDHVAASQEARMLLVELDAAKAGVTSRSASTPA